jgi:hypothetical protein
LACATTWISSRTFLHRRSQSPFALEWYDSGLDLAVEKVAPSLHYRSPTFDHGIALVPPLDAADRVGDCSLRDLAVDGVGGAPGPKRASETMISPGVVRHGLGDAPALHARYWLQADRAREHVVLTLRSSFEKTAIKRARQLGNGGSRKAAPRAI